MPETNINPDSRRRKRRSTSQGANSNPARMGARLERWAFYLYLALIALFPLPMGGGSPWLLPLASLLLLIIFGLWLAAGLCRREIRWRWSWTLLLWLIPLGTVVIQGLVPLPESWVSRLSPPTAGAWQHLRSIPQGLPDLSYLPLSLAPEETQAAAAFLLFLATFYALGLQFLRRRRDLFFLAGACIGAALLNAGAACIQEFSGQPPWYWTHGVVHGVFSGTYLNRNHFACLLTMACLLSLGMMAAVAARAWKHGEGWQRFRPWIVVLGFAFFILAVVEVLSLSRGGVSSMALASLALFLFWLFHSSRFHDRPQLLAGLTVLVIAFAIALAEAAQRLGDRYAQIFQESDLMTLEGRLIVWKDSLPMLKQWWLTGIGAGAYPEISPAFNSGWLPGYVAFNAHNDWLEWAIEFGLPVFLLMLLAFLVFLGINAWRLFAPEIDSRRRWLGLGTLGAIGAVMLHEAVDYNLRANGNAVVFIVLLLILVGCAIQPVIGGTGEAEKTEREPSLHSWRLPAGLASPWKRFGVLALLGIGLCWPAKMFIEECQAGFRLAHFQAMTSEAAIATRTIAEVDCRHILSLADGILAKKPETLSVLQERARWRQRLALRLWNQPGVRTSAQLAEAKELVAGAVDDMRKVCGFQPGDGNAWLWLAQLWAQQETMSGLTPKPGSPGQKLFDLALELSPHLPVTTAAVANYYWRLCMVSGPNLPPQQRQTLAELSLEYWKETVRQNPDTMPTAAFQAWSLRPDPARLRLMASDTLAAQEKLLDFFMERELYPAALEILDDLEKLNAQRPDPANLKDLPLSEAYRIDRRSRDSVSLLIEGRRTLILGLQKRWQERDRHLAALLQLREKLQQQAIADVEQQFGKGDLLQQETALKRISDQDPWSLSVRPPLAKTRYILGQPDEATSALMPLAYRQEPPPVPVLDQALELLKTLAPAVPRQGFSRQAFLATVLEIRRAEALGKSTADDHRRWLAELNRFEQEATQDPDRPWLQTHLLPFYAGRVQELAGNRPQAVADYGRCLKTCPHHLAAAERLAALGQPPAFLAELRGMVPAGNHYGEALTLLGIKADPQAIPRAGTLAVTLVWLCTGDIDQEYRLRTLYGISGDTVFNDNWSLAQTESPMLTWRVGEVVFIRRELAPMLMAAKARVGRPLPNGQFSAEVQLSPLTLRHLPPTANPLQRLPLFSIDPKR